MQMQIVEVTRLQPEVVAIVEIEEVTVQSMTDAFHEWASNDTELHGAMYDLLVSPTTNQKPRLVHSSSSCFHFIPRLKLADTSAGTPSIKV